MKTLRARTINKEQKLINELVKNPFGPLRDKVNKQPIMEEANITGFNSRGHMSSYLRDKTDGIIY